MYHKNYSSIRDKPVQCLLYQQAKSLHPHMYIMLREPRIKTSDTRVLTYACFHNRAGRGRYIKTQRWEAEESVMPMSPVSSGSKYWPQNLAQARTYTVMIIDITIPHQLGLWLIAVRSLLAVRCIEYRSHCTDTSSCCRSGP